MLQKLKYIYNNAVNNYPRALKCVPDYFKTQKMCNKAIDTNPSAMQFVPHAIKPNKCVIKLLIIFYQH